MQNQGIMNYMCSHQSKLMDEQENELFSQLNKAKLAGNNDDCHRIRNTLVEKNLGLVRKIIRQDYYQNHESGMTEDDLMQEGSIGLMKAIERFDSTRGRFSTYAWIWIRQSISRALENKARGIRVPAEWLKKEQMNESQNDNSETLQPEYKDRIFFMCHAYFIHWTILKMLRMKQHLQTTFAARLVLKNRQFKTNVKSK